MGPSRCMRPARYAQAPKISRRRNLEGISYHITQFKNLREFERQADANETFMILEIP